MATIQASIRLFDGMSPALRSVTTAMNIVINSFESMQIASNSAINTQSIQTARVELARAETSFNAIEQEIKEANLQQQKLNSSINDGERATDGLKSSFMKIGAAVGAYIGVTQIANLADTVVSTTARLGSMNDGLQTTAQLQDQIFASAQRARSSYIDTANAVSKIGILAGDAFANNQEIIAFAEQMNKQFRIGGSSIIEQTASMYQLTQAMAAGRLQGDEFRSIMENAPILAQSIAVEMGKTVGELRTMSSEGLITADVIKNAMFAAADETNRRFADLPITFAQIWTDISNTAIRAFEPVLARFIEIVNNDKFQVALDNIVSGLVMVAAIASGLLEIFINAANAIANNWGWIGPIIWGVVAALIAYNIAALANNIILTVQNFLKAAAATKTAALAIATGGAATAQQAFNIALLKSPITWIIVIIIALIVVFYAVIAAINHFTGTSISATGIIFGVFAALGASLYNAFVVPIWNSFASLANFFANVFNDPVASLKILFLDLSQTIIGHFRHIAMAIETVINKIPGVTVNITGKLDSFYNAISTASRRIKSESEWVEVVGRLEYKRYDEAFDWGYAAGERFNLTSMFQLPTIDTGNYLDRIYQNTGNTDYNTAELKNSMDMAAEELKYLRDQAEQEVINRFTTAEISVNLGGVTNNVNSEMDLDGVVTYLEEKLYETMQIAAEGVHS